MPAPGGNQCICLCCLWAGGFEEDQLRLRVRVLGLECCRIAQNYGTDVLRQPHGADKSSSQVQDRDALRVQT